MKNKLQFFLAAFLAAAVLILPAGCDDNDDSFDANTEMAASISRAVLTTVAVGATVISVGSMANKGTIIDSADVTYANDTLTIDYGSDYVLCPDSILRKGKIIVCFTNSLFLTTDNSEATIIYDNFFIADYLFNATGTIKNLTSDPDGNIEYEFGIDAGSQISGPSGAIDISATINTTRLEANSPPLDDVYNVGGSLAASKDGQDYTSVINQMLVYDRTCEFKFTTGVLEASLESGGDSEGYVVIDFGAGVCDSQITFGFYDQDDVLQIEMTPTITDYF